MAKFHSGYPKAVRNEIYYRISSLLNRTWNYHIIRSEKPIMGTHRYDLTIDRSSKIFDFFEEHM
jgi:hypothetical protein